MRITIKKSIYIAVTMVILLILTVIILTFMRIDRKVIVPGTFTYRNVSPLIIEESGFLEKIYKTENSEVLIGDTLLVLRNEDIDIEILNSENRIMIYKLELQEILQLKELDVNLSSFDTSKLKEQLKVKVAEAEYFKSILKDKTDLYANKIISKDEFEEANLNVKQNEMEIKSIEIQLNGLNKQLQKLDASAFLNYKLKQKELDVEQDRLEYLTKRRNMLTIVSKTDGKLMSGRLENSLNVFFTKGDKIGDVISFDKIDFTGYASGADIIRIKEGQISYFNVDTFRGKDFVQGKVKRIGLKTETFNGIIAYPIEIEVTSTEFFDRGRKRYIHAGVTGEAVIITEEDLPILYLLWERVVKYTDIN